MARYLALDWDHNHISIAAANVGGGAVRVQRAVVLPEPAPLAVSQAEEVGLRLRDHLKTAKVGAAPVVAVLGRDRLIVKDLRYPAVPDHEEPAVVRFQALKEMTHAPDEVIIDFARVAELPGGERRALVLIARREHVTALQTACKAAGLKLAGITARPFGLAACLERMAGTTVLTPPTDPPGSPAAVVAVGDGWAEFVVCKGGVPLLARTLVPGPGLAAEVKRSLTVWAGQGAGQAIRGVYVAGGPENAAFREKLRTMVEVPVHLLDPFAGSDQPDLPPPERRGAFAGLVGVLHLRGDRRGLPCDFLAPKQPKPPADPDRRRGLLLAALAATVLLAVGALGYIRLARLNKEVTAQALRNSNLDAELKRYVDDENRIKVLNDWNDQGIVWLDVLYDVAERFPDPDEDRVRLTSLTASTVDKGPKDKDGHVGRLTLKGVMGNDSQPFQEFQSRLAEDGEFHGGRSSVTGNRGPETRNGFTQQFELKEVGVQKRPPEKYTRHIDEADDDRPVRRRRPTRR